MRKQLDTAWWNAEHVTKKRDVFRRKVIFIIGMEKWRELIDQKDQ